MTSTSTFNWNPFAELFEPENDTNNVTVFEPQLEQAPEATTLSPEEAKVSTRTLLQCQLEKERRKPCPYHPLYFEFDLRVKGEPCPRAHMLTPRCPDERNGNVCQSQNPLPGQMPTVCPFYHKQIVAEKPIGVISKPVQKCQNEEQYGFCGFHPELFDTEYPPTGFQCPRVHERVPPCPYQRQQVQCPTVDCAFFHKKAYTKATESKPFHHNVVAHPATVASDLFTRRNHGYVEQEQIPVPIQIIYVMPPATRAKRHFDVPLPKICINSTNNKVAPAPIQ